jgi:hypothetical protein
VPDELVHALVLLLSGAFAAAGLTKLVAPAPFALRVEALVPRLARVEGPTTAPGAGTARRPEGRLAAPATVGLALGELALAVLLLFGAAPRSAGLVTLVVLLAFTLGLIVLARRDPAGGCGCFGEDDAAPAARGLLRNGALAAAAAVVALEPPAGEVWAAGPGPLAGALTVALGAACLWSLAWALASP